MHLIIKKFFMCLMIYFCFGFDSNEIEKPGNYCKGNSSCSEQLTQEAEVLKNDNKTQVQNSKESSDLKNIENENFELFDENQSLVNESDFENAQNTSVEEAELLNDTVAVTNAADNINKDDSSQDKITKINLESPSTETTTLPTTTPLSTKAVTKPSSTSQSTHRNDFNKTNEICFCDLKINECDTNCCCDEDCSHFQRFAFTKCLDLGTHYDNRYCYSTKFIYRNNTKHKIIENEHRLFCIVKDNLHSRFSYKPKDVITSLEAFNKAIKRKKKFKFSAKEVKQPKLIFAKYMAESRILMVKDGKLSLFRVPTSSFSLKCASSYDVRYLVDYSTECSRIGPRSKNDCEGSKGLDIAFYTKNINIVASPAKINKTDIQDPIKICQNNTCINITSYFCSDSDLENCVTNIPTTQQRCKFCNNICQNIVTDIEYVIYHNGTDGIKKVNAYFWLRNVSTSQDNNILQKIDVKFRWADSEQKIFERSGNPGYIVGKPVMAGKKIYNTTANNTLVKKEAIELSMNPNDWLSVFGISQGLCSFDTRIPVLFRENMLYTCVLPLAKDDFENGKCLQLQNRIFNLLIGEDFANITSNNFFNKFVATFGNSKVEETGDWAQVLIDLFPIHSSQVTFKSISNNIVCKNVITDMIIDIAFSNIGSFVNPQAKILGVSFQFGKPKDLTIQCNVVNCKNSSALQYYKISTSVHFIDLTEPAVKEFAEPPGLEAKLPHDFFYPFFSKGSKASKNCLILFFCFFTFILRNLVLN